jgi:hypothetical protein
MNPAKHWPISCREGAGGCKRPPRIKNLQKPMGFRINEMRFVVAPGRQAVVQQERLRRSLRE